ncbi:hypothetical protein ACFX2I_045668 [Malus domestica]
MALAELLPSLKLAGHRVSANGRQCLIFWSGLCVTYRRLDGRAGEQGLNLVGADTVVIHDMDFNPQIDRQAEDHCHCIGQVKVVTIYRLVTKGTIDENVYEIAERK